MLLGRSFMLVVKSSTVILVTALLPLVVFAQAKKTVCSATINSDNEIRVFKEIMGHEKFEYVELTKYAWRGDDGQVPVTKHAWFEKACEAKIQCDILIVSGHFGGTFFGSSGLILPMEELERSSCDKRCDGILKKPKEVFLFGCNTLAGKSRDHRSPEEYRRVLIQDGFEPDEAERIVSFRYSPFGDSFSDRMRQVFPLTPRIYGNESVGPVGKDIEGSWRLYLKAAKSNGYYDRLGALDPSINQMLMGYLKWTAISQVHGDRESLAEEQPVCKLQNAKLSNRDKLLWIEKTLQGGQYLRSLPHIVDYFQEIEAGNVYLGYGDRAVIERLGRLSHVKNEIAPLLQQPDDALLGMQLRLFSLMTTLGWMSKDEKAAGISRIVLGNVKRPFNQSRVDRIVSFRSLMSGIVIDFSSVEIPTARWNEIQFLKALAALEFRSVAFEAKLMPLVLTTTIKPEHRQAAAEALAGLRGIKADNVGELLRRLQASDALSRRAAVTALGGSRDNASVVQQIAALIQREQNVDVLSSALSALPQSGSLQKASLDAHLRLLAKAPAQSLRAQIIGRLSTLAKGMVEPAQIALGDALLRETSANLQFAILEALESMGQLSWKAWSVADKVDTFKHRTTSNALKLQAARTSEVIRGANRQMETY